ncbi:unnamed protein product [Adineta steineri]|uniref:G-protein coupled receptors family 1 profile domain-containing protein n=1 Tax=Adineta steineri TaxID=433720 RepID=A0A815MRM3_9BILA|nr:unnamed protein product [Adineta steineri]CAF3514325.1 unnamed protein product [Adineta steineri]
MSSSSTIQTDITDDALLSTNLSMNDTSDFPNLSAVGFSYTFQFWYLLICEIPSLACYLFVFIYILTEKTQRRALHNHSMLVLLVICFPIVLFDYSWTIDSCRREGGVWFQGSFLCQVWWLFDYGFYNTSVVILAWSSFQRHILIFHSNLVSTKRKRLFIHYLPLTFILVYLTIFYIYVIFFPPCENQYDFTSAVCGDYPCYLTVPVLAIWDNIVHSLICTFLIAIFNVTLLIRIIWQKRHQRPNWKKYRKMVVQLLSISAVYLCFNTAPSIIVTVQMVGYPDWGADVYNYFFFFTTSIQFLVPFICLLHLPNKLRKIRKLITGNRRRIMPGIIVRPIHH